MCVCSESMKAKTLTSPRFQSVKVQIHSIEILRSCVNFSFVPKNFRSCFQRRRLRVEQPFHVIRVRSIRSVERLTIAPSIKTKPNWGLFRVNMIAEHLKHHSFVRHSRPPIIFDDLKFWDICGLTFLEPYS